MHKWLNPILEGSGRHLQILNVRFLLLHEENDTEIHPFELGHIVIESASETLPQQESRDAFFLLLGLTDLLMGLGEFLKNTRIKKYVFTPKQGSFDLVFEKRKHACIALKSQNRVLNVYPEAQIYFAFYEAVQNFSTVYLHRFLVSDGQMDDACKDILDEFSSAIKIFHQAGSAINVAQIDS